VEGITEKIEPNIFIRQNLGDCREDYTFGKMLGKGGFG